MIEELIARVFSTRNLAHLEHWRATGEGSYARHTALGSFYDDVIDALDSLVEACQAVHGIIGDVDLEEAESDDVIKTLQADVDWVEDNHKSIAQGSKAVANLLDGVTSVYLSALYKLENLQ